MTELISEAAVARLLAVVSLFGAATFIWWLRRPDRAAGTGAGLALAALAWPLWQVFGWIDAWQDVTTLRGMAIPYLVFGVIGLGLGWLVRIRVQGRDVN